MNTIAILQARMTSTRLPGKVLRPICGIPALQLQVERVRRAKMLDGIVIATTIHATDNPVCDLATAMGVPFHRGSEDDVLSRYIGAAAMTTATHVVRLTGDCPLADPAIIDRVVGALFETGADYASNTLERTYPIGMDVEAFSRAALDRAGAEAARSDEREHVTPFIYRHPEQFRLHNVAARDGERHPHLRLTLDTDEDLRLIVAIYEGLYADNPKFSLCDILAFLACHPGLLEINRDVPHKWLET